MKHVIHTKGMHCGSCEILLREALEEKGFKVLRTQFAKNEIEVDLKNESQLKEIKKIIEGEGYAVA
jgi:copper chaperone CopZ